MSRHDTPALPRHHGDAAGHDGTRERHAARVRLRAGSASLDARVRISTCGLLAVGAVVAATLLSAAAIVAVSTRKLPQGAMPRDMRRAFPLRLRG